MTVSKRRIHRVDFQPQSEIIRQGVPFHMNTEAWDYGRNHAVPLWTEYVIYPAILSRGYKFLQLNCSNHYSHYNYYSELQPSLH